MPARLCELCASTLVILGALTPVAVAQSGSTSEEEAQGFFLAGRAAYDEGRYEDALQRFEAAHELSGRSELLYNIGLAADRARHDRRAVDAYEAFLAERPDTPYRESVEGRLRAIRRAMAEREASRNARTGTTEDHGSVLSTWWFWTIVGVVVVGAAVTTAVLVTRDREEGPAPGDFGVVLEGLRF